MLVDLLVIWGDEPFSDIVQQQDTSSREYIGVLIEAGVAYGLRKPPADFVQMFPLTYAATRPDRR